MDNVDGALARLKNQSSVFGKWLDGLIDTIVIISWWAAFVIGYYNQTSNKSVFFLLIIFYANKAWTDFVQTRYTAYFQQEAAPINEDMYGFITSKFKFLKRIPKGLLKNPLGSSLFPFLLSIGCIFNKLLIPLFIYASLHFLNSIKTIALSLKYRKV